MISYVARKPPFSLGRRGLAACACAGIHTSKRSDSLCLRKFSSICNANAVSNICAAPHALMQTNIIIHSRWIAVNLGRAVHSDTRMGRLTAGSGRRSRSLRGLSLAEPRLFSYTPPPRIRGSARLKRTYARAQAAGFLPAR